MNKKAIIMDIGELLWKLFLVIIVIICLSVVIFTYLNEKFETDDLELALLYSKFISTPGCLALQDGKIINPGLIDLNKFDKEKLRQCKVKKEISLRLSLLNLDNNEIKPPVNIGTDVILGLLSVCKSTATFKCFSKQSFISYEDNGQIKPAILRMEVIESA